MREREENRIFFNRMIFKYVFIYSTGVGLLILKHPLLERREQGQLFLKIF